MGIVSKGPKIVLRELRQGCTVSEEVGPCLRLRPHPDWSSSRRSSVHIRQKLSFTWLTVLRECLIFKDRSRVGFPVTFMHWFRRDRFWPQQLAPQLVRIRGRGCEVLACGMTCFDGIRRNLLPKDREWIVTFFPIHRWSNFFFLSLH